MTDRLEKLRKKLKARTGKPGLEKNCEALKAEIAKQTLAASVASGKLENLAMTQQLDDNPEKSRAPKEPKRYRSAETGEFVTKQEADENPSTTVSETVASQSDKD